MNPTITRLAGSFGSLGRVRASAGCADRTVVWFAVASTVIGCTTVPSSSGQGGGGGSTTSSTAPSSTSVGSTSDSSSSSSTGSSSSSGGACLDGSFDDDANASTPCVPWTDCEPGEYVDAAGTPTSDRTCEPCASDQFSEVTNAATCTAWKSCLAGTYVSNTPSADTDRVCEPCEQGEYTSGPNQSMCLPQGACLAGTVQTTPGNIMMPPTCVACSPGTYCAGAATPAVDCASNEFDNDLDPATVCIAKAICASGFRVLSDGSTTANRTCMGCTSGSFAIGPNAPSCTPWSTCGVGTSETAAGSTTADRVCTPYPWTRQFGHASTVDVGDVAVAPNGVILAVGFTDAALPSQTFLGVFDAFIRAYGPDGTLLWTDQFGTPQQDRATGVAVAPDGTVYVAGITTGALPGQSFAGSFDVFVRAYSIGGAVLWTRQFGTTGEEWVNGLAVRSDGSVVLATRTASAFPGYTNAAPGTDDAYVRVLSNGGLLLWDRQFGTNGPDSANAVAIASDDSVVVAGNTPGFPGFTPVGGREIFVRSFTAGGVEQWTRQVGTTGTDTAQTVGLASDGSVLIGGSTTGTFSGQPSESAFLLKLDPAGALAWARQFGGSSASVPGLEVRADGTVAVGGNVEVALPGQSYFGGVFDAFARVYSASGATLWTDQFGTVGQDMAEGIALAPNGALILGGMTTGTLPGQSAIMGSRDGFVRRIILPTLP